MLKNLIIILSCAFLFSCANNERPNTSNSGKSKMGKGKNKVVKLVKATMSKDQLAKAHEIIEIVSEDEIAALDAEKIYKINCALCHGFNGDMKINGAKDLTLSKISLNESVAQVYFGKGLMTPYKGILNNKEIVAVCQYIEKEIRK